MAGIREELRSHSLILSTSARACAAVSLKVYVWADARQAWIGEVSAA